MIIPWFSTHISLTKSLLTMEDEEIIDTNKPVSIVSISKTHNLKEVFVVDSSMALFIQSVKNLEKHGIDLRFGVKFTLCDDAKNHTEESLKTEHKIVVWMRNSDGYKSLIKLYSAINANKENFYYKTRGNFKIVQDYWDDNLILTIPPYSNFIQKNLLNNGNCVPDFGAIKPILTFARMDLPFDSLLENKIKKYAQNNNYETMEVHPIFYYKRSDFKAMTVLRCIGKRTSFQKPEMDSFSSSEFCFESYLEKNK